jgi:hypothetical protein
MAARGVEAVSAIFRRQSKAWVDVINQDLRDRYKVLQERLRDPLLTALTVLLVIIIFVVSPLHAAEIIQSRGYGISVALVLVGAVLVMSGSVLAVIAMLIAIGLVVAANTLPLASGVDVHFYAWGWVTLGLALLWVVARTVFAPGRVTYHRIIGAVLLYLTIGVVFVGFFAIIALLVPGSFSETLNPSEACNLIYFSFVTLTSVGYGDIVALHPLARSLCNVETIIGQLYPATLLARLVTLQLQAP